jgi:iron complex outermembrane receptor protein
MKYLAPFFTLFFVSFCSVKAQNSLRFKIIDQSSRKALAGVQVLLQPSNVGGQTDQYGRLFVSGIKDSTNVLSIYLSGYQAINQKIVFPEVNNRQLNFVLSPTIESQSSIRVMASRRKTYIEQLPIAVEVLETKVVDKKTTEASVNIGQFFNETSGIALQQTSGLSGDFQLRIRGLEGKYTQLLKDGLPLFGGLSSSFSLLQMPQLDLQQVEIIKGSASALYSADALAGVINLVSKRPDQHPKATSFVSVSQLGGIQLSDYHTFKYSDEWSFSLASSLNAQSAFDADNDGVADLLNQQGFVLSPRAIYQIDTYTHIDLGLTYASDKRTGGVMDAIQNNYSNFLKETNNNQRITTHFSFETKDRSGGLIKVKNGLNFFSRNITQPQRIFEGNQLATYTEITYQWKTDQPHQWLFGGVFSSDDFTEGNNKLDYFYRTFGGFVQDDWRVSDQLSVQANLRADYVWKTYPLVRSRGQGYVMPKLSVKYKILDDLDIRLSSGLGYKNPSPFNYQTDQLGLWNVQALSNKLEAEQAFNTNADIAYKYQIGTIHLDINQGFFYTNLQNYLSLVNAAFANSPNIATVSGFESNINARSGPYTALLAYTYTNSELDGKPLPFAPRSKTVVSFNYEKPKLYSAGFEMIFVGKQYLGNDSFGRSFGLINLKAERHFGKYSVQGRIQNLANVRQSNWGKTTDLGSPNLFNPIYAPLTGILINIGLKIHW